SAARSASSSEVSSVTARMTMAGLSRPARRAAASPTPGAPAAGVVGKRAPSPAAGPAAPPTAAGESGGLRGRGESGPSARPAAPHGGRALSHEQLQADLEDADRLPDQGCAAAGSVEIRIIERKREARAGARAHRHEHRGSPGVQLHAGFGFAAPPLLPELPE